MLHMNIVLLIGIGIFCGLGGGKIFQRLKIPQVVGYIIIGVLLGDSALGLFPGNIINTLTPMNNVALGLIGFMIGGELKRDIFKKYGKKFIFILLWEGLATFFLVTAAVTWYTGKLYVGILFGALASATAPAATVDVLWEYKSKGILTSTILAIVALDDGLALILYGFASAFAKTQFAGVGFSFFSGFVLPVLEISYAIILGSVVGYTLYKILLRVNDKDHLLVLSIGAILVNTGLSTLFNLDLILTNMTMGVILANQSPRMSKRIFESVKSFTPPIYVLFFVLVGARLQISLIPKMGLLGLIYVVARTIGKFSGCYFGAIFTKADETVRKYLGLTLFSQAGVAIGLSIAIYQSFSRFGPEGEAVGNLIINVITATTFIVQIIGPPCVKLGIQKAGEIGKDISEDDLLDTYKVEQVMDRNVESITTNETLSNVLAVIKNSAHIDFPLITSDKNLLGMISFQNVKDIIFDKNLENLVLAGDLLPDDVYTTYPGESLKLAMDKFMFETVNYLPVVESKDSRKLVGILPKRETLRVLKREMIGKLERKIPGYSGDKVYTFLDKNTAVGIKADTKKGAITEMVNSLESAGKVKNIQGTIEKLLEREALATTGIGNGVAFPHVRTDEVSQIVLAFGRSINGIEFNSIDKKPVHIIFMILTPVNKGEMMLKIMSTLSGMLNHDKFLNSLIAAENSQIVMKLLQEWEEKEVERA